jgi:hypothetical protein
MNVTLSEAKAGSRTWRRLGTTICVYRAGSLVGAILLNEAGRTKHCTPDIPADVILKILFRFSKRDELRGEAAGRDGGLYRWCVRGAEGREEDETDEAAA